MTQISTFYLKRGDTAPAIQYALDPTPDLTGATVVFNMKSTGGVATVVRGAATIVGDATDGVVKYSWVAADTDTAGNYNAEFEVTYNDGTIETFPNGSNISVRITDDLG